MLSSLKLVQGSVAKKDFVPALTHFHIEGGRIYGFNGTLAMSAPIDLDVTATPKAVPFVKAVEALPDGKEIVLNLTNAGKLSIKAGNFRAYVDCHDDAQGLVKAVPTGVNVPFTGEILPLLRRLAPFMGQDASRPWALGIQLTGQSAFVTNNIILIEHWVPFNFPGAFVLPSQAIKEILRIKKEPVSIQICENSATFHYENTAWLKTQLINEGWPDISRVLDKECSAIPFHADFFEGLTRLTPFLGEAGSIHLAKGKLSTHLSEGEGAIVDLPEFDGVGCHQLLQLAKLSGVANSIDFLCYPAPCLFFGDMLRGCIIGMRN